MAGHEISQVELDDDEIWRLVAGIVQLTAKELKTDYKYLVRNESFIDKLIAGKAKYDLGTVGRVKRLLEHLDNWSLGRSWILGYRGNYEQLCAFCHVNIERQREELRPFTQLKVGTHQIKQAAEKYFEDRLERIYGRKRARAWREAARRMAGQVGEAGEGLSRSNAARARRANSLRGAEETGTEPTPAASADSKAASQDGFPGGGAEDPGRSGGLSK